jgi:methylenetetrahydrofolate reductase (NADPH)
MLTNTSYTMNLAQATRMVLEELELLPDLDSPLQKPLPWRPSLGLNRRDENVRPIFWRNRNRSYVARTQDWDEFPNGRWGDARSPAFGELDSYGIGLKGTNAQNIKLWGAPVSIQDVSNLFVRYMSGELDSLPWSEAPISKEADTLRNDLIDLNRRGFLTINSQPAVNGAKSSHAVYGWGPRNGYVYQKAYLETLVSPEHIAELITRIERDPDLTYYAVNKDGDLKTNAPGDGPNAVTWGVFPGKEIVQPTIVETVSFLAWKDEFYKVGKEWANCHASVSPSRYVIEDLMDTWYLVNIGKLLPLRSLHVGYVPSITRPSNVKTVHNDFHIEHGIFPLFNGLQVPDIEKPLHQIKAPNGDAANGDSTTHNEPVTNGKTSTLNDLVEAAKSAAETVTSSINGLKVSS